MPSIYHNLVTFQIGDHVIWDSPKGVKRCCILEAVDCIGQNFYVARKLSKVIEIANVANMKPGL